ncbi:MAG: tRNA preQ1(34) S-adenosylmethionine ribosyltransferase-isomerase QueA [Myxococcales bacterium]|nr:tRNA preQ1(34) S-adenosylmethionine ribosyltransferase-isomerase QueA [Myxococcales bacterium]
MRVDAFDYVLPEELIAQEPAPRREEARLLVVREGGLADSDVARVVDEIPPGALVVVNDTRVVPARLHAKKRATGGHVEVFLVRRADQDGDAGRERWHAMVRASKALKQGAVLDAGPLEITFVARTPEGLFEVELRADDVSRAIADVGQVPLPPYIRRAPRPEDRNRYQTIFARVGGAVAAPTAGLHLTHEMVAALERRDVELARATLHVGLGTFQPVAVDDLDDHPMHAETIEVSPELASSIARARERGAPVVAIGTTVVRALESAADDARAGHVRPFAGDTRLLIQPGYAFRVVDMLLTNFHLPRSTLLALVCAFGGTDRVLSAYRHAVESRYRFFSYGDAMFLRRDEVSR